MNIGKLSAAVALAAGLGLATPALAQSVVEDSAPTGAADETGQTMLGIDISMAGRSPEAVSEFIAGLAPDTQRGLIGGCQTAVEYPGGHHQSVVGFCTTALEVTMGGPPMGFAPEDPGLVPEFPPFEAEPDNGAF